MRTLSLRELNRAALARQLLLEREKLPLVRAVEQVGGLQAQWSPSPYIALWSRVEGFRFEQLERALARQDVVKATLMRSTLHIVSRADYALLLGALLPPRIARLEKRWPGLDVAAIARRAQAEAARGDVARESWYDLLREHTNVSQEWLWPLWSTVRMQAGFVHALPSGSYGYFRGTQYVPVRKPARAQAEPMAALARRYLGAFGPASAADIAYWAGLQPSDVRPGLEALSLREFRDEKGRKLFDLPGAPLPDAEAPVRYLPKWDLLLLAYAPPERERVLPERFRKTVIRKNGDVLPTFLVDGFVAGTWKLEQRHVVREPFGRLSRDARVALDEEAQRLEAALP